MYSHLNDLNAKNYKYERDSECDCTKCFDFLYSTEIIFTVSTAWIGPRFKVTCVIFPICAKWGRIKCSISNVMIETMKHSWKTPFHFSKEYLILYWSKLSKSFYHYLIQVSKHAKQLFWMQHLASWWFGMAKSKKHLKGNFLLFRCVKFQISVFWRRPLN